MAIIGQNSLLNQYTPTFFIKNLTDGQTLKFDAVKKAFINVDGKYNNSGANKLGELLNVSSSVDSPSATLSNNQALVYNALTSLWENSFVDYTTLRNKPSLITNFTGLTDTLDTPTPNGYVLWNSTGTQLVYSTTIPAASITDLYINDLLPPQSIDTVGSYLSSDGTNVFWVTPSVTPTDPVNTFSTIAVQANQLDVPDQQALVAVGPEVLTIIAGDNISIVTDTLSRTITINSTGTVSDLLPANGSTTDTFTIPHRHQYIVTGRLEIVGHVINNGRIAVL